MYKKGEKKEKKNKNKKKKKGKGKGKRGGDDDIPDEALTSKVLISGILKPRAAWPRKAGSC